MNLGGRIKVALERAGMNAPEACRRAEVPLQSVNALMRRDSRRSEFTDKLLSVIPDSVVNKDWVRTGRGSPDPIDRSAQPACSNVTPIRAQQADGSSTEPARQIARSNGTADDASIRSGEHQGKLHQVQWVSVPRLTVPPRRTQGADIASVKPKLLTDEVQAFRSDWIIDGQLSSINLAWSRIEDESMEPMVFERDCYVVDTSQTTIVDGKTYSVCFDGVEGLRRCFRLPGGGLRLIANNTARFPQIDLNAELAKTVEIVGRMVYRMGKGDF